MKRKVVAMTLAITVSLPVAPVSDLYQAKAAVVHETETSDTAADHEANKAGGAVHEDISDQVIQEGGFLAEAADDGIMPMSDVDDAVKKQVQEKLKAAWDSVSDECDLTEFQLTPEEVRTIYFETINQYPRYFFLEGGYSRYSNAAGLVTRLVDIGYSTKDTAQITNMLKEYDAAVAKVISNASSSWSDMEKALYVNDYLARSCAYDTTYSKYNAYDALVGRSAVCQGYALAFRELTQQLGLSCEIVSSDALNHAWNLVKINGSYYHVDVTWNDPIADRIGRAQHYYFMKSSNFFQNESRGVEYKTHKANDWEITGGVLETAASDSKYDDYFWNKTNVGFEYIDGNWYGFDGTDSIRKYTCSGTDFTAAESIQKIEDIWHLIGGNGGYWQGKFVGLGASNGSLIYSGKDKIYELDVQTKTSEPLFELTQEQKQAGHIYSINVTPSGEIEYLFAESPNVNGTVYKVEFDSSRIVFDGNSADGGSMSDMVLLRPNQEYSLPANLFTKKGYDFKGWNTQADGSGTAYEDKASVSQASVGGSGTTLYAQWEIETEHSNTEIRGAKDATCTEEGYTGDTYCLDCGTLVAEGEAIPKKEHSWDTAYTVDKEPTLEEAGQESIHCKNCDAVKDVRELPKLESGQEQLYQIAFDGNGADSGSMERMVLYTVGQEYALPANAFAREGYVFKGWNTQADGNGDSYADGAAVKRPVEDAGSGFTLYAQWEENSHEHVIVIRNQKDATCTEDGYTGDGYCEVCDEMITQGEVIPKLGHEEVMDEAVAATCTAEGKTQGSHCSRCGVFIKIPETIPALGHDWEDEFTIDRAPTAEETGLKSIHCSRCDARKDEQEIPKLTDAEQSYEVVFDGNGADSGSMDKLVLSVPGQSYSLPDNQFVRGGYIWKGWNTKADGTGTAYGSQGQISFTLEEGGTGTTLYAQWEVQEAHVHTIVQDPAVAATCTEAGRTQGSHCSVCGEVIQAQAEVPALGHSWNSFYTIDIAPTYFEAGKESIHCRNCSEVKDSRIIPRLTGGGSSSGGYYYGGGSYGGNSSGSTGTNTANTSTTSKTNADGSVTKTTVTQHASGGTETVMTTTKPNGSVSEITVVKKDASGRTETERKTMTSDGSVAEVMKITEDASGRTETTTVMNTDGSVASTTIVAKDASGRTVTKTTTEQVSPTVSKVTEIITTPAGTEKTETTTEHRADGALVQTQVKTSANGRTTTITGVTNADGSAVQTVNRTVTNTYGMETDVITTTRLDSAGFMAGITEKSVIRGLENAKVSVSVKKDAEGNVQSAAAAVTRQAGSRNTAVLPGTVISQIKEAAGQDVEVTMTVQGTDGSNLYKLKADTKDLYAGNKLRIYRRKSTGEYIMVNAKSYTVSSSGNVAVSMPDKVMYELVSQDKAAEINRKILSTAAAKKPSVSLNKKGSMQFGFRAGLNLQNVKGIRYQTSDKKIAAVSRTGKIKGKKAGTAVVKAVVELKNGSSKTVSIKVRVK